MFDDDPTLPMIEGLASVLPSDAAPRTSLTLPYDARKRSRQRVRLDDGKEAALLLPRGTLLRGGDRLQLSNHDVVVVKAAPESVSTVVAADPVQLARVAYHLGNRHVPLQVGAGWLRYQHDHVLDDMVRGLGAEVRAETAPFEPEGGAHAHGGDTAHTHAHEGPHPHDHGSSHHG